MPGKGAARARLSGLRNFGRVNEHVFRGAQPAVWGYKTLAALGVKTVVNLRTDIIPRALEKRLVLRRGMDFTAVPLSGHAFPSDADVTRLLAILNDPARWPVFIHCRRGADRTGAVIAAYRIANEGWDNQRALDETKEYDMNPARKALRRFILQFRPGIPAAGG